MMRTPTTRKLSKTQQYSTLGYIPIADDEVFYKCVGYNDIYVSQYAQFIQVISSGETIIRNTFYDTKTGYTNIVLTKKRGKKTIRKCWGIHTLVGEVWLEKPTFAGTSEKLQVHHKIKIKRNLKMQPIDINFAENLQYVYLKYHKLIDSIRNIKVSTYSGNWKSVKSIEDIAEYYSVPLIDIYELLQGKPSYVVKKVEYYESTIAKKKVGIEIRKFVTKKKK
jgi:hypothetical protein